MMSGREKALRWALRALGGGTIIGVWVALAEIRWLGQEALGRTAVLVGVSVAVLLIAAIALGLCGRVRGGRALGRSAMDYLSGALMGLAIGVLLLVMVELITAAVGLLLLKGYGG